ncbi:hypothetical protein GX441_08310 [bacterium]|nr:hypothetical protein [bacterium]
MKRIITIAAIIMAAAIPIAASAQVGSYYYADNSEKTLLVEWIQQSANKVNGIHFDTPAHMTQFLALCQSLYAARDAENWTQCTAIAQQLLGMCQYIIGAGHRTWSANNINMVRTGYLNPEALILLTEEELNEAMAPPEEPTATRYSWAPYIEHLKPWYDEIDSLWYDHPLVCCYGYPFGYPKSDGPVHFEHCHELVRNNND